MHYLPITFFHLLTYFCLFATLPHRLNQGGGQLYDPIPTKHELLLFQACPRAVAVLASYPRSGNSLMRTLYEHTTLRVTGSDMQGGLAKHGEIFIC
jgi:hypothetical protein